MSQFVNGDIRAVHDLNLPFTDFDGLKAHTMESIKDEAHYLGDFANFARRTSTTFVFLIIGIVAAVSLFFNSQLDLFRESHKLRNRLVAYDLLYIEGHMNSTNISINELRHLGFAGVGAIIAASTGGIALLWNLLVGF